MTQILLAVEACDAACTPSPAGQHPAALSSPPRQLRSESISRSRRRLRKAPMRCASSGRTTIADHKNRSSLGCSICRATKLPSWVCQRKVCARRLRAHHAASPSCKIPSVVDSSTIFGAGTISIKTAPAIGRKLPPRMLRLINTGDSRIEQQGYPLVGCLQPCGRTTHLFSAMRMLAGNWKKRALSQQLDQRALTPK